MKKTKICKIFLLVVALVLLLTACGGSKKEVKDNGKLMVYNWGEYIDPEVIAMFEKEYGIQVIYDMFETNEEMYPQVEMGAVDYDVICPSEYMIEKLIQNDLLMEIDFSKIPNAKNLSKKWMDFVKTIDDNKYTIPYMVGSVGILYNKTLLDEKGLPYPEKWADLWKEEYKGEVLMQNSVRDAMMVALKKNGFSMNSISDKELEIAIYDLLQQKPLVQAYVVDQARDKMISGEAMIGVIYSGEVMYVCNENPDYEYRYVLPEEGTNVWLDGWVIPNTCQNIDNAHKWIDYMCRPDIAKKNAEFITYESPNEEAKKIIDEGCVLDEKLVIDNSKDEDNELYRYLGDNVDDIYNEKWKRLKAE